MTFPIPSIAHPSSPHRRGSIFGAIGFAAALALTLCETAMPYQPLSAAAYPSQGRYSEHMISPDVWQVSFSGNTLTSRETVESYLLYRAAELAVQAGYDWFEIVDQNTESEVRQEHQPYDGWRPMWRYYNPRFRWRSWSPFSNEPFFDMRQVERYEAVADIEMHKGPVPSDHPQIFDARQVIARLGPTIRQPGG